MTVLSRASGSLPDFISAWRQRLNAKAPASLTDYHAISTYLREENEFHRTLVDLRIYSSDERLFTVASLVGLFLVRTRYLQGELEQERCRAEAWAADDIRRNDKISANLSDSAILDDPSNSARVEELLALYVRFTVLPVYLDVIHAYDLAALLRSDPWEFQARFDRGLKAADPALETLSNVREVTH